MEEFEEKEKQPRNYFILLDDTIHQAKRLFVLGLVLIILCSAAFAGRAYLTHSPRYTATASFTVRVTNPLYAKVSSYNTATAKQMALTFPHILTSGVLQERVREHLGIAYMPPVSVYADENTSVITMSVTDGDPQRANDVL